MEMAIGHATNRQQHSAFMAKMRPFVERLQFQYVIVIIFCQFFKSTHALHASIMSASLGDMLLTVFISSYELLDFYTHDIVNNSKGVQSKIIL